MSFQNAASLWKDSQPLSKLDAWLGLVGPLCAVTFGECLHLALHHLWLVNSSFGPQSLLLAPYLLVSLPLGFAISLGLRQGKVGFISVVIGVAIALYCVHNFRGSHQWPTLFDWQGIGATHLYGPFILGVIFGFAMVLLPSNQGWTRWIIGFFIIGGASWCWIDASRDNGIYSLFPYSRHLALGAALAICGALVMLSKEFTE